jgi:hypothetical protein
MPGKYTYTNKKSQSINYTTASCAGNEGQQVYVVGRTLCPK